jgi:hypothetical protein
MDRHEMQTFDERTGGASTIDLIAFLDDASRFIMHYRLILISDPKRALQYSLMHSKCGGLLASSEATTAVSSQAPQ